MRTRDAGEPERASLAPTGSGTVSRRQVLKGAVMGASALGVGAVLEACGSSGSTSATSHAHTTANSVTGGLHFPIDMLDPTTASDTSVVINDNYIYESLYRLDLYDRSVLKPQLATDMPQQVGPKTFRIPIRKGVTFHDGTPLTADDVVFTINRILSPKTNSLLVAFFPFLNSSSARAISPTVVELDLLTPCTLLPQRLALVHVMSQAAVTGPNGKAVTTTAPIGSGPYKVSSFVSDQQITLERFSNYSGSLPVTYKTIHLPQIQNDTPRLAGLETGTYTAIEDVPIADFNNLSHPNISKAAVQSFGQTDLLFHCGKPPFNDYRARQAVLYALNRELMTTDAFFGHAIPAWDNCLLPSNPGYITPTTIYSYDPDKAKSLLAAAGVKKGTPIQFLISSDVDYIISSGPIIQQNLDAIGLDCQLIPGASNSLYGRVTQGKFNAFLSPGDTSLLGVYDTEALLRWDYYGTTASQFYFWTDSWAKQTNSLLNQALASPTVSGRNAALATVQNIIQTQAPAPTIHFKKQLTAWSDNLVGFRPMPTGALDYLGVKTAS
jgi:peptide/nickel transport system substrate-binding protein